ncbi:TPA: hypothetical protein ACP6W0_004781, partial [Escherichia coli]
RPNRSLSAYTPCGRIVTEKQIKPNLAFFLASTRKELRDLLAFAQTSNSTDKRRTQSDLVSIRE